MARTPKNPLPLGDTGETVSCSLKLRGGIYRVQFPDPKVKGKYREVSTGRRTEHEAWAEAGKIVLAAYRPTIKPTAKNVTWDQVLEELPKSESGEELRTRSVEMYAEAVANLRRYVQTKGPGDVTAEKGRQFKREYASTPYTKSPKPGAKQYTRSDMTVYNALHRLSCLWGHLAKMGYASTNPWEHVPRPSLKAAKKKRRTIATEDDFVQFFAWVDAKEWELMSVFLRVKAVAGCRTIDLCSVRVNQFDPNAATLTITDEQDKTGVERVIDLPADLVERLKIIRGGVFLWDRYTAEAKLRDSRASDAFAPKLLAWAVTRLVEQYRAQFPERARIKPHDMRARAITLFVKATGSVDAASEFFSVSSRTASRHYVDGSKAFERKETAKRMAGILLPKPAATPPSDG